MGGVRTDSFLARPRRKMFPAVSVVRGTVTVTYSGSVLFSSSSTLGNFHFLSSLHLCHWIVASGHDAFFGMAGYLGLAAAVTGPLGLLLLVSWLACSLRVVYPAQRLVLSGPRFVLVAEADSHGLAVQ